MAELTVLFLDSGQGDSTLVVFPDKRLMLVDCGCTKNHAPVLPTVIEALNNFLPQNHGHIDWLVITHPDQDHYNMLIDMLTKTGASVGTAWYGGDVTLYKNNGPDQDATYRWLDKYGKSPGVGVFDAAPRLTVAGVNVHMLAANALGNPANKGSWAKNSNSIVLLLEYEGYKVFLMGDATWQTEEIILKRAQAHPNLLQNAYATSLKMGHHGSLTSSSEPWVKALTPNALFASADAHSFGDAGVGMPAISHITNVVNWSGNLAQMANHPFVAFGDQVPQRYFATFTDTRTICTTLVTITWEAIPGQGKYKSVAGSWHLTVKSNASVGPDKVRVNLANTAWP